MTERTLTDADVEAIARAVEERLRGRAANERPREPRAISETTQAAARAARAAAVERGAAGRGAVETR